MLTVRNNPSAEHWNADEGYRSNVNESDLYPYRVFSTRKFGTLAVALQIIADMSHTRCGHFTPGFMLFFHMPDELPDILMSENFIPAEQMVVISVIPRVTITSNDLQRYAPQVRRCYLRSERPLHFFRSYSQRKCELECLANFIKKTCNCVSFWMPSTWQKSL